MLQHYAPQFAFPTVSRRKQKRYKKEYSTEPETPEEKDGPVGKIKEVVVVHFFAEIKSSSNKSNNCN